MLLIPPVKSSSFIPTSHPWCLKCWLISLFHLVPFCPISSNPPRHWLTTCREGSGHVIPLLNKSVLVLAFPSVSHDPFHLLIPRSSPDTQPYSADSCVKSQSCTEVTSLSVMLSLLFFILIFSSHVMKARSWTAFCTSPKKTLMCSHPSTTDPAAS